MRELYIDCSMGAAGDMLMAAQYELLSEKEKEFFLGKMNGLGIPEEVKANAVEVYEIIAQAESKVHGKEVEHVHFHEVGTLDAVADVVGNCLLMYMIKPERVTASPIHVGSGIVSCAHGELPVPAPATAEILTGIPCYGGEIKGELCTPTGAALLKYFVSEFGPMPAITIRKTGYGVGTKEFQRANCVRIIDGESWFFHI